MICLDIVDNSHINKTVTQMNQMNASVAVKPNKIYEARLRLCTTLSCGAYSMPLQFSSSNVAPSAITLQSSVRISYFILFALDLSVMNFIQLF